MLSQYKLEMGWKYIFFSNCGTGYVNRPDIETHLLMQV